MLKQNLAFQQIKNYSKNYSGLYSFLLFLAPLHTFKCDVSSILKGLWSSMQLLEVIYTELLMRWSSVRIAHDPPSQTIENNKLPDN